MTTKLILRHDPPRTGRDPDTHLYAVGQAVRLKGGFRRPRQSADIYHITRTLPSMVGSPQYRIRNDDECHERVAAQDSLEPVHISPAREHMTLIERTFDTQPSRDPKAQKGKGSGRA